MTASATAKIWTKYLRNTIHTSDWCAKLFHEIKFYLENFNLQIYSTHLLSCHTQPTWFGLPAPHTSVNCESWHWLVAHEAEDGTLFLLDKTHCLLSVQHENSPQTKSNGSTRKYNETPWSRFLWNTDNQVQCNHDRMSMAYNENFIIMRMIFSTVN